MEDDNAALERLQARMEYLAGMLHARAGVLACGVPVAVLLVAGCQPEGVHPALVAACLVGLVACVIWFNPWGCLNRCLSPLARSLLLLAVLLAAMAALMAVMGAPAVAVVLLLLAALAVSVALWRRKAWLLAWQVRQCPEVDTVLAHLSHGGEFAPAAAWDEDGCRQTRALLHQALGMECDEQELSKTYKAVYLLAYLCGMENGQTEVERLKKDLSKAEAEAGQWMGRAVIREDNAAELDYVKGQLAETREALRTAQAEAAQCRQELEMWKPQEAEGNKEAAVLAYLEAGHSYREAADRFGISKSMVGLIVKQGRGNLSSDCPTAVQ